MKKTFLSFGLLFFSMFLSSCFHLHDFDNSYNYDESEHWYECINESCNQKTSNNSHYFLDGGSVVKKATETENGILKSHCLYCDYEKLSPIEYDNHKHEYTLYYEYDVIGHWSDCIYCTSISKNEHDYTVINESNGTCYKKGTATYKCNVCKFTYETDTTYGHNLKYHEKIEPTCSDYGYEGFYECVDCDKIFKDEACDIEISDIFDLQISKLEHTFEDKLSYNEGYHWYASTCNHPESENKIIHKFVVAETIKDSTCFEEGIVLKQCSQCDYSFEDVLEKKPHNLTKVERVEASCTENGNIEYYICACNSMFTDINAQKPVSDITILATGHSYEDELTGCENGHYYAATCGHDESIEMNDHNFLQWITTSSPNCEESGSQYHECDDCGYIETVELKATGHTLNKIPSVSNTCLTDGNIEYYTCECGKSFYDEDALNEITNLEDTIVKSYGGHIYDKTTGQCNNCEDYVNYDLEFSLSTDGTYYIVKGRGSSKNSDIRIPSTYKDLPVKTVYAKSFYNDNLLKRLVIPSSVTSIGDHVCYNSTIEELVLGCSIEKSTDTYNYLFYQTKIKKLVLLDGVKTIVGRGEFFQMKYLEEIVVSDTVESLPISIESNTTIKYNEYENGLYFGNEKNPYALFMKVKNIKSSSFTLHEDTKNINTAAFKDYELLIKISLPKTLTKINESVFSGCIMLNNITVPDNIKRIENSAFENCESLMSFSIPSKLEYIGEKAFKGCLSISSLSLPDSVTKISSYCFASMERLSSVTLNSRITELPSYVFSGCKSLKNINFCLNIVRINNNAFDGCTGLRNVKLPDKLFYLGSNVFNNCTGISTFEFTENMTNLTASMIAGAKIQIVVFTPKHTVETALIESVNLVYFYGSSKECKIDWPDDFKFKWYSATRPAAYSVNCWHYVNGIPTLYS